MLRWARAFAGLRDNLRVERSALFLRGITGLSLVATLMACNAISGAGDLGVAQSESRSRANKYDAGVEGDDEGDTSNSAKSGGSSSSGGTTDAGVEAPDATAQNPTFTDDFGRANGAIGNAWVERTNGVFTIKDGEVKQTANGDPPVMLELRPSSEDAADAEVSVTVRLPSEQADASLYVRVQPTAPSALSGYGVVVGLTGVSVEREEGTQGSPFGGFAISPALAAGEAARLVVRVTGTNPVKLDVQVLDGSNVVRGSGTIQDSAANRIQTAGAVGFGGMIGTGVRYDDFKRVTLLTP